MIPRSLMGGEKRTQLGLSWQNKDIEIDTLKFAPGRFLQDIYESIKKARTGRKLVRDEYKENAFVLEGFDRDGSRFNVQVQDRISVHGLSVVYSSKGGKPIEQMAREIVESFQLTLDPDVPVEIYLKQAREVLITVAGDPGKAKTLWVDFAVAARKYRLRVGRTGADQAVQGLLSEYPGSPLQSALWGTLPLGPITDLSRHKYWTESIYGTKTQYPSIRDELMRFLSHNPKDPFAFAAYYAIGAFDKAIAAANKSQMPSGMLHYASAHKRFAALLQRAIPHLDQLIEEPSESREKSCPPNEVRLRCYFYETYAVSSRLGTFAHRASKTDPAKLRGILQANPADLRQVVSHLEIAAKLNRGLPHEDDANYYLGVIFRYLGQRDDAFARFEAAVASKGGEFARDYASAARHQIIEMLLEIPEYKRIAAATNIRFSDPAVWYVLARDAYRRYDYSMTIRIAELGLERLGIETWRLPVTTESPRIEDELGRLSGSGPKKKYIDINLVELIYLLNAAREMDRFGATLRERGRSIDNNYVRSVIVKYSLLATSEKEQEKLQAGRLGQHRDLRQAIHLADIALQAIPHSASPPHRNDLREWLLYRKIRILGQFEPKLVESAVGELEREYPSSMLLDDAFVELLYTQAFVLRMPDATVNGTFRLITERFATGNAADNAYNWYAVYLRCRKDYEGARRINMEIIRRFPLTRHAIYAAARLASPVGCGMWYD
jgi:hypothetical protein